MDKRTTAIVVTVAAILLCGCPGLCGMLFGGISALASFMPGADINVFGNTDPQAALTMGIATLCGGIVFVLIAAGAIFFVWRRKSDLPTQ